MPELPEVEVVRRGLAQWTAGRTVRSVEVLHGRAVRRHAAGPRDFAASLTGATLGEPRRRGKYLWVPLAEDAALLAHLGMSGQFLVGPEAAPYQTHLRVRLTFADDLRTDLRFVDQRTFGGLSVQPTTVKRALLDQTLISGVGNIYADESLWRTRLHYERPTATLTRPRTAELLRHIREVMGDALTAGGTSFDSMYVNVNGESGYFDRSLDAYGREDQPCRRCATPIRRRAWMNRSSYFCPRCQRPPRAKAA